MQSKLHTILSQAQTQMRLSISKDEDVPFAFVKQKEGFENENVPCAFMKQKEGFESIRKNSNINIT